MTDTELLELAKNEGFAAALIPTNKIVTDPKFRPFCEENRCGKYGANYSCPPDCGTVEETRQRLTAQKRALVVQTVWDIDGYENKAVIQDVRKKHNTAVLHLTENLRKKGLSGFCLGYGGCSLCDPCKRVNEEPCPHPDKKISCLSAYCIDVAKLAAECCLPFAWEHDKLYLFGIFAFHEDEA